MTVNVVDEAQTSCHCGWDLPKHPVPVTPKPGEPIDRLIVPDVAVVMGCPVCGCRHVFREFKADDLAAARALDLAVQ